MNEMVFELQPEIIVNNRNQLPGDFTTPEQRIQAAEVGRAWETCMTLNDSWGFNRGDDAWKTPKLIVDNLATCARGGGNYLLNIGPEPDGSIPPEHDGRSETVGKWLETNGEAFYGTERGKPAETSTPITRAAATSFISTSISGLGTHPLPSGSASTSRKWSWQLAGSSPRRISARLLKTGQKVEFTQDEFSLRLTAFRSQAPDQPATVIEVECDGEPMIESRRNALRCGRATRRTSAFEVHQLNDFGRPDPDFGTWDGGKI